MIKDPLNSQETPYDILDLDMNTPMCDIHQALPRFMKKNKVVSKISIAQEAIRKLKSVHDRISFDITYYALEVIDNSATASLCDIHDTVNNYLNVPVAQPPDYLHDALASASILDIRNLPAQEISKVTEENYLKQPSGEMLMPFEREEFHA